ncbi:MAG: helix-turn-helix transcriptional regulator [Oscillospiraceae bacterium]
MNTIGKNIKEARKSNGFTQAQLAEKAGISRSYLAGVEQDNYNPSVKTLLSIASACQADLNFLAGMTEKQVKVRRDA